MICSISEKTIESLQIAFNLESRIICISTLELLLVMDQHRAGSRRRHREFPFPLRDGHLLGMRPAGEFGEDVNRDGQVALDLLPLPKPARQFEDLGDWNAFLPDEQGQRQVGPDGRVEWGGGIADGKLLIRTVYQRCAQNPLSCSKVLIYNLMQAQNNGHN